MSDLEAGREQLTDTERAILLAPCGCGHTINDHGSLVACWLCEEDGGECSTTFEDLLVERVGVIVAARTGQGAPNRSPEHKGGPLRGLRGSERRTANE